MEIGNVIKENRRRDLKITSRARVRTVINRFYKIAATQVTEGIMYFKTVILFSISSLFFWFTRVHFHNIETSPLCTTLYFTQNFNYQWNYDDNVFLNNIKRIRRGKFNMISSIIGIYYVYDIRSIAHNGFFFSLFLQKTETR